MSVGMICQGRHDNGNGAMHGGMICTLADIGLGKAVRLLRNRDRPPDAAVTISATIQLDVSFCGRIGVGDFVCTQAIIKSMSRSLTFAQGELRVGDRTVATMQGVFKVIR
ncbi:PaaI family thioesterase [Aquibium oceanicum]|nr:PaaI family thioesterase [Aquibium oceanicum]